MVQTLEAGRAAVGREAWEEAWKTLTEADSEESLSPPDLELLADSAWWAGHPDESVDALERAYAGYVGAEQRVDAARVALLLAYLAMRRLALSVAAGWKANAVRLLEDEPETSVHAFLKVLDLVELLSVRGDVEGGLAVADEALEAAKRTGNREAESLAKAFKGYALVASGMWKVGREDGLPLHLVVCDELAFYLTLPDKRQRQEFAELLRDLVARGRAAGVIVVRRDAEAGR